MQLRLILESKIVFGGNYAGTTNTGLGRYWRFQAKRDRWTIWRVFEFFTRTTGSNPTEKVRIDNVGNVGIGTTGPGEKVEVAGNLLVSGGNELKFSAPSGAYAIHGISSGLPLDFNLWTGSVNTTEMRMQSDGNVGIGTTNPALQLTLSGATGTRKIIGFYEGLFLGELWELRQVRMTY